MKKLWSFIGCFARIGKKLSDDNLNAFSAQAAFFLFVSLFPFIMLLLALLQFFPFDMEDLINAAEAVFPDGIKEFFVPTITEIYQKGTPALISVTAVTAIWSASTGVNAIIRGLSKIYDSNDAENWLRLRIKSIFYMLGLLIVIILSLGLFVFGNLFLAKISELLPHISIVTFLSTGIRLLCGVCALTLIFSLIYIFSHKKRSRFFAELPGALISAVGWAGFSYLYSFYINNITNFSVYGSLTLVVFFLLWIYVCFYFLFLGAEVNRYLKGRHSRQEIKKIIEELKQSGNDAELPFK